MSKEKLKAIILMILSSFSFALMQILVKQSSGEVGLFEQIFARNVVSTIVAVILVRKSNTDLKSELKAGGWILWGRSVIGYLGIIVYFYAVSHGRQAEVSVLYRLGPVFITIMAALVLHEKITSSKIAAIVLCMAGAYIAMSPSFNTDPLPLLCALASAAVSGVSYTFIAMCRGKASPSTIVLHYSVVSCIFAGVMMIPGFTIPSPTDCLRLIGIGLLATAGQLFLSFSYTHAPASEVSIYDYVGVPFSALLGYLAFNEALTGSILGGGAVIFIGVLVLFLANRKAPAN